MPKATKFKLGYQKYILDECGLALEIFFLDLSIFQFLGANAIFHTITKNT